MTTIMTSRLHNNQGYTLIELMVSMVLSLFLMAGMVQLFIGTRHVSQVQDSLSRVQENGRFALDLISRELRKTGYKTDPFLANTDAFPAVDNLNGEAAADFVAGQVIWGTDNMVIVRYLGTGAGAGDGLIQDCRLVNLAAGNIASIKLRVNNSNQLVCQSVNATSGTTVEEVLVNDVESMVVTYGEDTSADTITNPYTTLYRNAASVVSWNNIMSVRVQLLLVTADNNLIEAPQSYRFNGATTLATDNKLRRSYSTVISLRNRLP